MREIEIKARVQNRKNLIAKLREMDVMLGEPVSQHDRVFAKPNAKSGDVGPWLRIRTETKNGLAKHIFTLKKSVNNQLDSIEHETEIADDAEMGKAIFAMSYDLYSDLTKTRQKAKIGDVEICVDYVNGLGDFIEAETLTDNDANVAEICENMWGILNKFGVEKSDEVFEGYDVMMRNKM